jgi:tRNA(fMet)-specific endonuclease VapC
MIDVLLDTNIVIYVLQGKERYVHALQEFGTLGISVISAIELFTGAHDRKEYATLTSMLLGIQIVPLGVDIGISAAESLRKRRQKSLRSSAFADTVIAHTALSLGVPLVTNNPKDFKTFPDLEIVTP